MANLRATAQWSDATFRAVGWLAHGNGEPAAPALNVDVRDALENLPVGHPDVLRIMRAFQRGWMDANFAADVPTITARTHT